MGGAVSLPGAYGSWHSIHLEEKNKEIVSSVSMSFQINDNMTIHHEMNRSRKRSVWVYFVPIPPLLEV